MKTKLIKTIIAVLLLTTVRGSLLGQGNNNIDIRFLKAKFTDTTSGKTLVAVFLVSTKDTASFPPEVTLPPKCTVFENKYGFEKVVNITQQMLSVDLYDERIREKNKDIYELIKNQVDFKSLQTSLIITYTIKDINYDFNRMTLTPAFREKRNRSVRIDKRCEFTVQ